MLDEMGGQDVDVILRRRHVGVTLADGGKALVPKRHAVENAVRFRGGCQMPATARPRELIRIVDDPIDAAASKYRLLDDNLIIGTFIDAAADARILALVVLTYD